MLQIRHHFFKFTNLFLHRSHFVLACSHAVDQVVHGDYGVLKICSGSLVEGFEGCGVKRLRIFRCRCDGLLITFLDIRR